MNLISNMRSGLIIQNIDDKRMFLILSFRIEMYYWIVNTYDLLYCDINNFYINNDKSKWLIIA